ncbi:GNAT family N-acetyltransferase [Halomonas sp. CUBES01]|uniref:tRNA(Met) cytidine acetyltransferase TmcA n=1 Tax=Vreelandella gomseomensis TaxID=370766 RepID=A0ABU1G880_9GAMM|nr:MULTISPECIES: GNAT family N-acetyltransferase [Halomonas]MDR5873696.1 GNAT family N-acetyltransferase [Halomonas gomseomensis]MEC4768449.1 GNAT family N-acetyltransferase [Halomonas sp. CUBES01]
MPSISTDDAPVSRSIELLCQQARRLARRRWRQLVWLQGDAERCREMAVGLWQARSWSSPLWIGDHAPVAASLKAGRATTRLGSEHQLVVVDAHEGAGGFNPDALGAVGGTLAAGGLLVLITPEQWGAQPDPDYARIADYPREWAALSAHYLARLARQLKASTEVIHWTPEALPRLGRLPATPAAPENPRDDACLTLDQAVAVSALVGLKRRRPLVITADRGRGKSAAMGIACMRLLRGKTSRVIVTAPRLAAVESLFERAASLCPEGQRSAADRFVLDGGQELRFVTPDALSEHVAAGTLGGDGSYLMVDEAAALPAPLLAQWLTAFPRIAFATTVHGYEGSGRGFALRFRGVLDAQTPDWKALTLTGPVRWQAGDPLEATLDQLLLLHAPLSPAQDDLAAHCASHAVSREALARDETALGKLFGLLVQSHYRTTPSDLRQLLDGPDMQLRVSGSPKRPQAVLVTCDEGGFTLELAHQVARGERRPQGHLMAQSLAAHGGCREALTARWRRVVRIASHPGRRRQGVGSRLLSDDQAQAAAEGIMLYGATFGAEAGLLRFWRAQGFVVVRLGVTREASSGEFAVMVAKALTPSGARVLGALHERFVAALPGLLAFELASLPAAVVSLLIHELPERTLTQAERQDIIDVATAHRSPALARASLQALARDASRWPLSAAGQSAHQQLAAWAFQNQPLADAPAASVRALRGIVHTLWNEQPLSPEAGGR